MGRKPNLKKQVFSLRTMRMFAPRECWLIAGLRAEGVYLFYFETNAQTDNILPHSEAPQYQTFMHYPRRQAHVLVICKATWTKKKPLQRWEVELLLRDSKKKRNQKNPSQPSHPHVLYLHHLGLTSVHLLSNSCIRCKRLLPRSTKELC